ncbi:uncharacterized protein LOC129286368 [Prosopis cineraria]|uniref:uncharacterized protein LOC129286368 n=1 Tax=Prosopis cineraria TaxID=364024 RepID=UPI00240EEC86|nr:uncharacterized protein LOC129286368 [Prosopis cineraria]
MAKAVEEDLEDYPEMFEKLKSDAETPLYAGQIPGRLLGDVSPSGKDSCTVPSDKIPETVGDALGSFVAWPSHLVMVGTPKPTKDPKLPKDPLPPKKKPRGKSKLKDKVSGHTKESVTVSQHAVPMPVVENKFRDSLETYASATRMIRQEPIGDIINFDDGLFGRASFEVVRDEILNEILKHDMASTSLMTFYMSHLYTSFVVPGGLESKIKLVNPHDVSPHNNITKEALENQYFEDVYCVHYTIAHVEEVLEEITRRAGLNSLKVLKDNERGCKKLNKHMKIGRVHTV